MRVLCVTLVLALVWGGIAMSQPPRGRLGGRLLRLGPDPLADVKMGPEVITHGAIKRVGDAELPFVLEGDIRQGLLGDSRKEINGGGLRFLSGVDSNQDGKLAGEATCTWNGLQQESSRWYRIRINGLAQPHFSVESDELFIRVEFFKDQGTNSLDYIKKPLLQQIELERQGLHDERTNQNLGPATWRNYALEVRTPFPEVDTLKVTLGFARGNGQGAESEFWIREVEVRPIPDPSHYVPAVGGIATREPPALKSLVKLGGRWFYEPTPGSKAPPTQFDTSNSDRLYYLADRLETPFAGNTSAWLRRGSLDYAGNRVETDRYIEDSMIITFSDEHLVIQSKNLPNHPTAVFPDRTRQLDGNPNVIREQRNTWYIPLEPKANPNRLPAMTMENKQGLPMGPIGVAVNGVVFFNPFDHIEEDDAVWRLDRCCGHPSPRSVYHYHKYPVCVNTPWADDGTSHSPLIGFAFDGFPVYGPYESKGVLAKDARDKPLNEYNVHADDARGPHYHVTPGAFPHMIGGYWGDFETRNRGRR